MFANLRKYFFSGLLAFLPLTLTVFLFIWVIGVANNLLGKHIDPFIARYFGFKIPGLGLIVGIFLIIVTGFFVTRYFGHKLHQAIENIFLKLPFFKQVYPAIKEIAGFFFSDGKLKKFQQVVLFEYPRKGIYSFGFLTNETCEKLNKMVGKELCNVFLSSSPSPITGFTILVPKRDLIMADISVEEAMKFIMSGGVINPQ